ncbi:MAG: hypothetical protein Q8R24_07885, partial [Legionellaceae bacterium]|nr:hypothetical protein [Legionellaceae bacterium]
LIILNVYFLTNKAGCVTYCKLINITDLKLFGQNCMRLFACGFVQSPIVCEEAIDGFYCNKVYALIETLVFGGNNE